MAVPTITSLSLTTGSTQGWTYVEITGTNFRAPVYTFPPGAPVPVPPPSISVLFGTVEALETGWISSTLIYALTPQTAPGLVGITVTNNDNDGVAIPGETVTMPAAFTFGRPDPTLEDGIKRLIRKFVYMLRNQVFANFDYAMPDVDYSRTDEPSSRVVRVPNLTLDGPNLVPQLFWTQQGNEHKSTSEDSFLTRKRGTRYNLEFTINGASRNKLELMGFRSSILLFFRNNTKVVIPRDTADPTAGNAEYELVFEADGDGIRSTSTLSVSSVSTFTMSCYIRGYECESAQGYEGDSTVYKGSTADDLEFGDALQIQV